MTFLILLPLSFPELFQNCLFPHLALPRLPGIVRLVFFFGGGREVFHLSTPLDLKPPRIRLGGKPYTSSGLGLASYEWSSISIHMTWHF